jgi:hypothetical protein
LHDFGNNVRQDPSSESKSRGFIGLSKHFLKRAQRDVLREKFVSDSVVLDKCM